jgi:hypothetical protein
MAPLAAVGKGAAVAIATGIVVAGGAVSAARAIVGTVVGADVAVDWAAAGAVVAGF